jgi:hypothetical protein
MARTRVQGGPTGDCPPRTLPHRESTEAFRLRRPCLRRRAGVVPRIGRFSGVDQGRHSNHLHAVGLGTPRPLDYQLGRSVMVGLTRRAGMYVQVKDG